ncbi:MAG: hypothetical protein COT39_00940 [Parcubacteria group bacterium CG08_land_8_20_14_0_20_48_21]|nr:MAG: hypothetical protein AUK21_02235 [Parcubacteria group bacterium CG2_30_48_51]PIS33023.1 MAG: hypothetical protein COT39_00940 [Parcubacteria group bacterium CG08_land_8_20_14_0_20_48_21]PIW79099.1 MAG: hypothetical protein COZ99_02870 [Parcubacteria group bacterium CG_4_8_14_3_um_filter_48_16]PIY78222.1 MAG: hypothetical protein COY83_01080 [Parcubacteria group bacterium CG_4_10_14_0_8_um_filter_48_154]PIZ78067.1 MAG: hypothetical protein COY03_00530 [bacterium CG_4_10_14_0_2_um_filter_
MLEKLFDSSLRVQLLHFFLTHTKEWYAPSDIKEFFGASTTELAKEIALLFRLKLLETDLRLTAISTQGGTGSSVAASRIIKEKVYRGNAAHPLYADLRSLFIKDYTLIERTFIAQVQKLGSIVYLTLAGFFTGDERAATDMLIVGTVSKKKLKETIEHFERLFNTPLRYTIMGRKEFLYRREVTDRFLYAIFESKHIVVIDTVTRKNNDTLSHI